jgi:hypothetical protein
MPKLPWPAATLASLVLAALAGSSLAACGGQSSAEPSRTGTARSTSGAPAAARRVPVPVAVRHVSTAPRVSTPGSVGAAWTPVATVGGQVAAWIAQRAGVTLLRFDQQLVRLALHAGSEEPGGSGWAYGASIGPHEVHRVIAGFNGGFRLNYGSVGFYSYGRSAAPLSSGLGSIVTYRDGSTQIAAWHAGVPARGRPIASVRQNLRLLIDHGLASMTVEGCVIECWGRTVGGGTVVARSGLGIDGQGRLVWAAGESLSPADLANALLAGGAQRAVELDINPFWVAGYLYVHHPSGPSAVPVVPGQHGIAGELLEPDARDFFTVLAR